MKLKSAISVLAFSAMCASPAFASEDGFSFVEEQSKLTQDLLQFDANKDGVVTVLEKANAKLVEFIGADADKDTFVTWDEFKAQRQAKSAERINKMFAVADKNADKALSSEEFALVFAVGEEATTTAVNRANTVFAILDSSKDGLLNSAELAANLTGNESQWQMMWQFAEMDSNGDAKLATTEYASKLTGMLPKAPKLPTPKLPTPKLPTPKLPK